MKTENRPLSSGMYGNYAALQLEDGRIRFGQEISQGISISFMGQNFGFNEYIFTENGAQTVYQNDSGFYADETLTIVSIAIYPLVGFSARIGFDVVQFCKDLDSVIN